MSVLVIFASGSGSNFEAILRAIHNGTLNASIGGLICDQADAYCLQRAKTNQIPSALFLRKDYASKQDMDQAILNQCQKWKADWLILAGYMRILTLPLIQAYPKHILNIHPSLLPKFKGKDALGQALNAKETTLGISIHYVDEGMDTGELIAQFPFKINENEERSMIEQRAHTLEHIHYSQVIQSLLKENS